VAICTARSRVKLKESTTINLLLFNKPFGVLSQFRPKPGKRTLAEFIDKPHFYPAGRLDEDSEGLLLLTNDGTLQARISNPKFKLPKTYLVQVEGVPSQESIKQLVQGIELRDGRTRPAKVQLIDPPDLPERDLPIRSRKNVPVSWLKITITEGKNRQVRRMTAAIGHPTLRLLRTKIGTWQVNGIHPGEYQAVKVNLPKRR
jgi:23S rRNA pseudouridine2457 synthase